MSSTRTTRLTRSWAAVTSPSKDVLATTVSPPIVGLDGVVFHAACMTVPQSIVLRNGFFRHFLRGRVTRTRDAGPRERDHAGMTAADLDVTAAGGVTVLGNLSVDYVDGGGATAGGCPSFAGVALAPLSDRARIVVRAAAADLPLFSDMRRSNDVRIDVLPAATTSSFALDYDGDTRTMTVLRIGPTWTPADIRAAAVAPPPST